MATVKRTPRSPAQLAADRVFDADTDDIVAGRASRFPERTAIVPADLATPEMIERYHAGGSVVVVVDADGGETFLPAP